MNSREIFRILGFSITLSSETFHHVRLCEPERLDKNDLKFLMHQGNPARKGYFIARFVALKMFPSSSSCI